MKLKISTDCVFITKEVEATPNNKHSDKPLFLRLNYVNNLMIFTTKMPKSVCSMCENHSKNLQLNNAGERERQIQFFKSGFVRVNAGGRIHPVLLNSL